MTGYFCPSCPLAFELGDYIYWDCDGRCILLVCAVCGTMHKIVDEPNKMAALFCLPEPIYEMVDAMAETHDGEKLTFRQLPEHEWRLAREIPPPPNDDWDSRRRTCKEWIIALKCFHCGQVGKLTGCLSSTDEVGGFKKHCPVCDREIEIVYVSTVN